MIEDRRYLAAVEEMCTELQTNLIAYNEKANGVDNKDELLALRLEQNTILTEMVVRHRRAIEYLQGKPLEPIVQFGESVLIGVGA